MKINLAYLSTMDDTISMKNNTARNELNGREKQMIPLSKDSKVLRNVKEGNVFLGNSRNKDGKRFISFNGDTCEVLFEGSKNSAKRFFKSIQNNRGIR